LKHDSSHSDNYKNGSGSTGHDNPAYRDDNDTIVMEEKRDGSNSEGWETGNNPSPDERIKLLQFQRPVQK
jgi:hypothetical protein